MIYINLSIFLLTLLLFFSDVVVVASWLRTSLVGSRTVRMEKKKEINDITYAVRSPEYRIALKMFFLFLIESTIKINHSVRRSLLMCAV